MENVKLGKAFDEEGESISDVEKVLARHDIALRQTNGTFRDMNDVMDDTFKVWKALGEEGRNVEQSQIAMAFAGTRQNNIFRALMDNEELYRKGLLLEADALGTVDDRYAIYQDNLEASANRAKAAWEKLIQSIFPTDYMTKWYNLLTQVLALLSGTDLDVATQIAFRERERKQLEDMLKQDIANENNAKNAKNENSRYMYEGIREKTEIKLKEKNAEIIKLQNQLLTEQSKLYGDIYRAQTYGGKNKPQEDLTYTSSTPKFPLPEGYESSLKTISAGMEDGATALDDYTAKINELNLSYENGSKIGEQYYNEFNKNLSKLDFDKMFGDDQASKIEFINATLEDATDKEAQLKEQYDANKIGAELYAESLLGLADTYSILAGSSDEAIASSDEFTSKMVSTADSARNLYQALQDNTSASMEQVESLKKMFPQEYINAISIEGNEIKINTQAIREMTVAKALQAVEEAKAVVQTIRGNIALSQRSLAEAKAALSIAESERIITIAQKMGGQAAIDAANNTVAAAKSKIQAEEAAAAKNEALLPGAISAVDLASQYANMLQQDSFWLDQTASAAGGAAGGVGALSKEQSAYNDILKMTISMIKQQKEDEKKALEEKLKNYKKIIDAEKALLDAKKEQKKFDDKILEDNKKISEIDTELLALEFDNSEEGRARKLELEAEKADSTKKLEDDQYDYGVDKQKEALDAEYSKYEEMINKKIKAIDDYLSQSGTMMQDAIKMLRNHTDAFYNSLINWNRKFGTGIDEDVIGKWQKAIDWVTKYKNAASGAGGGGGKTPKKATSTNTAANSSTNPADANSGLTGPQGYHEGGWVGGTPNLKANEQFAKLLNGEYVATQGMISNFMGITLPSLIASGKGTTPPINIVFNVSGNLDKSVIPDIKALTEKIVGEINNTMFNRGFLRSTNQTVS